MATKPILEPRPVCSACGEGPAYEQHVVIDLGSSVLTVGAAADVAAALVAALGDHAVTVLDDPDGRPSYGVVLPDASVAPGPRPVARLQRGPDVLLRSRRPERVLRALLAQIGQHLAGPELVRLDAVVVGASGGTVLAPVPMNPVAFERAAGRLGLAVGDLPSVLVDPADTSVLLGPVGFVPELARLMEVAARRGDIGREDPPLPWGRRPLTAITVAGPPGATAVLGELGPLLGDEPAPLGPFLDLARRVRIERGPAPEQIMRLLGGA